ncbi:hypothetical protein ASG90_14785 [Nocardioides sp. Soil797]|nr:hypothetical protein ASG90_14785 [Nocardioides sp. Soil797]
MIVDDVLDLARSAPAHLSGGRLICIDGPAGSGKTTLAAGLAEARPGTVVLHMDDMYAGWGGLDDALGPRLRDEVMAPLAAGEPGHYRRFDWHLDRFAELHLVPPCDLLVLEGVGSGARELAAYRSTLVWVEAPDDLRLARGLARDRARVEADGAVWDEAGQRASWDRFLADEARFFAEHHVRESADLHVDGTEPRSSSDV